MSDLFFLPSLRRGLADHVATVDPGVGAVGPAEVTVSLTVAGEAVDRVVRLLGPHHVASIASDEIVRRYPVPGADDVETNDFPLVEFRAPDLPWRFTPARAGVHGRLRPWLALVVVDEDQEGVIYTEAGGAGGRLSIGAEQLAQLPPSDELWGWAHVQSSRPLDQVRAAAVDQPDALRSRLLCPRRLQPGRTYRAAVVNTFAAGTDEQSEPAWTTGATQAVDLVVYDTWTFTTSPTTGDFESLCELLEPATEVAHIGVRAVDVTDCGLDVEWPNTPMVVDLVGAMADPGVIPDGPPAGTAAFAPVVEPVLEAVLGRAPETDGASYDPMVDDPVVGLPFYGSWAAAADSVPDAGWARALNVRSTHRIAAGLGARTVRHNQEALMAAAWDQLGSIREAADELNRGRLSAEVGRSWQARLAAVEPGDRLGLAASLLSFVTVDTTPARTIVEASATPTALLDRVWLRRAPRGPGASAADAFLKATAHDGGPAARRAVEFQLVAPPQGIHGIEVQLTTDDDLARLLTADATTAAASPAVVTLVGGPSLTAYVQGLGAPRATRRSTPLDRRSAARSPTAPAQHVAEPSVLDVANALAALDPLSATRTALVTRIGALERLLPTDELPAELRLVPEFTDALIWDLVELDQDVIVPGLGELPNNRVRLLAVHADFVAAYLVGANHEMSREFLWREYPVDLAGTFFRRFFDYGSTAATDIGPIADWPARSSLGDNVPNAATTTVILLRADLVRRYPELNVYLAPGGADGRPNHSDAVQPSFESRLGNDALVVGFPCSPEAVLGEVGAPEYFVVLEERMVAPRFGLDVARAGRLTTWDELAWPDVGISGEHVSVGPLPGLGRPSLDGVTWGRNAAHLAAAVHQRPYRRCYAASMLVTR